MSNKLNIIDIIGDHWCTLRDERSNSVSKVDVATFFIVPVIVAAACFITNFKIPGSSVATIITALSIFAGLLINVLVLIYTVSQSVEVLTASRGQEDVNDEKRFLRELFANISYSVLLCMFSVIMLLLTIWSPHQYKVAISAAIIFLLFHFVLTLMMAVKRIHLLLTTRFK